MWLGGLTELLRVSAQAAAYDIQIVRYILFCFPGNSIDLTRA
jgi:hypothetical protein